MIRCNRCGRRSLHQFELPQAAGFSRFYCNDPDWGFDCWPYVRDLYFRLTGIPYPLRKPDVDTSRHIP